MIAATATRSTQPSEKGGMPAVFQPAMMSTIVPGMAMMKPMLKAVPARHTQWCLPPGMGRPGFGLYVG
jgi:hypothetical protein